MAILFKIENKLVLPNPETLLIAPFKQIWERDKSKDKEVALQEFAYIEFNTSVKATNPFRQYPKDKKESIIRQSVIKDKKWKPDELVKKAFLKVEEFQKEASIVYQYYLSTVQALEKVKSFFNDFDLNKVNPKTLNPIDKPKEIISAVMDTEELLTKLLNLEKKVLEEFFEETKSRANKKVSYFAKSESITK